MKVLVAIANHGAKNQSYLDRLLKEYRSMVYDVDVVILSNIPKDLGDDIEVRVGLPAKEPWSLPFGHKELFAQKKDDYDLFIYSEDDTLITEKHIRDFLDATNELPPKKIAGFLRYEEDEEGDKYCSSMHSHYHWQVDSVAKHGDNVYASYSNLHSACFILTQNQLKECIDSGGFLVEPHEGLYDMLCSAATDPYMQCGLEKVICISKLDDFLLHHMPNQYLGRMGQPFDEMHLAASRLLESLENPLKSLLPDQTNLPTWEFEKHYHEKTDSLLLNMIPAKCHRIISVGCGSGVLEGELVKKGYDVLALPLDGIVSVLAGKRGVKCLLPDWIELDSLKDEADVVLMSNILCYVSDPVDVLRKCGILLKKDGCLLLKVPNLNYIKNHHFRRFKSNIKNSMLNYNFTDFRVTKKWLDGASLKVADVECVYPAKFPVYLRGIGSTIDNFFAKEIIINAVTK